MLATKMSKSNNAQRLSIGMYVYYLLAMVNRKLVLAIKTFVILRRGIIKSGTCWGVIATTCIGFSVGRSGFY